MGTEAPTAGDQKVAGGKVHVIRVGEDLHTRLRIQAAHDRTNMRALAETIFEAWFQEQQKSGHGED